MYSFASVTDGLGTGSGGAAMEGVGFRVAIIPPVAVATTSREIPTRTSLRLFGLGVKRLVESLVSLLRWLRLVFLDIGVSFFDWRLIVGCAFWCAFRFIERECFGSECAYRQTHSAKRGGGVRDTRNQRRERELHSIFPC